MKRSWLSLASLAVLAMAILGYTLVYASNSTGSEEQTSVVSVDGEAKGDCPWSAKSADHNEKMNRCSEKMKSSCDEKRMKKECGTRADREECRKKCESRGEEVEVESREELEFN